MEHMTTHYVAMVRRRDGERVALIGPYTEAGAQRVATRRRKYQPNYTFSIITQEVTQ